MTDEPVHMGPWNMGNAFEYPLNYTDEAVSQPSCMRSYPAYAWEYPDIYYEMQPYVMRACDEIEFSGIALTDALLDMVCVRIRREAARYNPRLSGYMEKCENPKEREGPENAIFVEAIAADRMQNQRCLFDELLRILLLSELRKRQRRRYW